MTPEEKSAYMKAYRAANREKIREQKKAWSAANPDKVRAADKRKYARNGEKIRDRVKKYREERPETIRVRKKKYYDDNRERCLAKTNARYRANRATCIAQMKTRYEANKEGRSAYAKARYRNNPDYYKEKSRNWKHINPERYMLTRARSSTRWRSRLFSARGSFTQEQINARFDYFGWQCRYCRASLTVATVTLDHQLPLSRGGSNWASNLVPACGSCNASKCDRLPWEFRPEIYATLKLSGHLPADLHALRYPTTPRSPSFFGPDGRSLGQSTLQFPSAP